MGSSLLAAAFLVLLQLPTEDSPAFLPWIAVIWASLLPAALFLQPSLALPPLPADAERLFPDAVRAVDEERYEAGR